MIWFGVKVIFPSVQNPRKTGIWQWKSYHSLHTAWESPRSRLQVKLNWNQLKSGPGKIEIDRNLTETPKSHLWLNWHMETSWEQSALSQPLKHKENILRVNRTQNPIFSVTPLHSWLAWMQKGWMISTKNTWNKQIPNVAWREAGRDDQGRHVHSLPML